MYCSILVFSLFNDVFSFGVLCVCRMNCKGDREPEVLEIIWPRSSPKIFPFFLFVALEVFFLRNR